MQPDASAAGGATSLATLFPAFTHGVADVDGVRIPYLIGGSGPAVLLLHGHPQTRAIWHRVAPALARHCTVVASDLRGYGDAGKPDDGTGHAGYSKRAMAADQVGLMRALGLPRFAVVGHDRGARVAHRLAADHPDRVDRVVLLDIAPTLAMYERADRRLATAYWHWFFLIQPAPLPERLIAADPAFYLEQLMGNRSAGLAPFAPVAWSEYVRCMRDPRTVHAICEDYRASATIDLEHDRADRAAGRRLAMPVRVLWGEHGVIGRLYDPLAEWRAVADTVDGGPLACGHYIPEEAPQALLAALDGFL